MRLVMLLALVGCGGGGAASDAARDAVAPDASCTRTPGSPIAVGVVDGIGSTELSGLAASRTIPDLLWTHGDSGSGPDIDSIGATTAAPHGTLHLTGATAVDWEDIDAAPCAAGHCIYVADTGDNDLSRTSIAIFEVPEPAANPIGEVDVATYTAFALSYSDGPHDVEATFVDPRDGAVYGLTKVSDAAAGVYHYPLATTPQVAEKIAELAIPATDTRVTGADMFVDDCGARILVRSHTALYELAGDPDATVLQLLAKQPVAHPVADEPQGEAIAFAADGGAYFTISEGAAPTLYRVDD